MASDEISRRALIKIVGAGMASVYFGGCTTLPANSWPGTGTNAAGSDVLAVNSHSSFIAACGPFDRTLGDHAPESFSGDLHPEQIHKILWHKKRFIKSINGLPPPTEFVDVVIVGGGMGGLLSAYHLKDYKPVVLEQAPRFGGNSRGESWQGIDYSIATAYFDVPEKGSDVEKFIHDVGMAGKFRVHSDSDPVFIDGKRYDDIWNKGTVPESKKQFQRLTKHFEDMATGTNGLVYPNVPTDNPKEREYANKLDQISFQKYVEDFLGESLHPHVEHVMEHYFWSANACSAKEINAAVGLNFFVGDFDKVAVPAGGNGAIAEAVLTSILKDVPEDRLRPSSLVFDVRVKDDGVHVSYVNGQGKAVTLRAKTAIMSCPKFVLAKIMEDLENDRLDAIKWQDYRSYVVANLLLNKHVPQNFYDLFLFSSDEMKIENTREAAINQKMTDMVYGNFTKPEQPRCVLTLFRGYPYDGARKHLYEPDFYKSVREDFEKQIRESILPVLGLNESDVVDLRLARWGHPLPVPQIGNFSQGRVDLLRKPFKERVFFVEQDNWAVPSFESVFHEAKTWTPKVAKFLSGSEGNKPVHG